MTRPTAPVPSVPLSGATGRWLRVTVRRLPDEPWRDAVERIARPYGVAAQARRSYMGYVEQGYHLGDAAWLALTEWSCLRFEVG